LIPTRRSARSLNDGRSDRARCVRTGRGRPGGRDAGGRLRRSRGGASRRSRWTNRRRHLFPLGPAAAREEVEDRDDHRQWRQDQYRINRVHPLRGPPFCRIRLRINHENCEAAFDPRASA